MHKIKIAFIISNLGQGGAENQLVKLVINLDKSKYDIRLLLYAAQTKPFFDSELDKYNIKTTKIKLFFHLIPFKIVEALYRINRFLNNEKFDIVVTSLFMNNLFVRLAAPGRYKNRIVTNMRTSGQNYSNLYKFWEKRLIPISYIVFNSKNALNSFKKIIPAKYHSRLNIIYNGYDSIDQFSTKQSGKTVFGSLGRLNIEKNILQAVRVFQEFVKENSEADYIIQGHFGNQHEAIKEAVTSAKIEIREKNSDIEPFYNSINILILPSIFEGCPNVLFEALLRKKLCIISAGANSDGFIQNGVNGFVYDGTDIGLLQVMINVSSILNTSAENRIKEAGYNYAYENFSIKSMVFQYQQLFLNIHEENKGSNKSKNYS